MKKGEFVNTLRNALSVARLRVMVRKIWLRITNQRGPLPPEENLRWIRAHCRDFSTVAESNSPGLWREAQEWAEMMEKRAEAILADAPAALGGGGVYPYLYFLTRWLRPRCIVETGVAAGYSSCAFLSALQKNGTGRLLSSDFPYFRLKDPERFIGILVDDELKDRWTLYTDGDETNLPLIVKNVEHIDLFHYDSEKRYSGRRMALSIVAPKLSSQSIVVMDDIQDNSFFHDYVQNIENDWNVFEFQGKYVGLIWNRSDPAV